MASPIRSINDLLAQDASVGDLTRLFKSQVTASTTSATTSSGGQTAQRMPDTFTVPSFGGSVVGAYATYFRLNSPGMTAVNCVAGLEFLLGTLTVSSNTFSAGTTMPSRVTAENPTAVQSAALFMGIYISTTLVATNPVLTITYVNQSGVGSRTATLTLPTNSAINSMFLCRIHLQSGDTGVREVTNMSISTGSSGEIRAIGVLPLCIQPSNNVSGAGSSFSALALPVTMPRIAAGDTIGFYKVGSNATGAILAAFQLNGET